MKQINDIYINSAKKKKKETKKNFVQFKFVHYTMYNIHYLYSVLS